MGRRSGDMVYTSHTPLISNPQTKDDHNCKGSPQGMRGSTLTSGSPSQGFYTRKMSPQPRVLHQEDEHLVLKICGTCIQESLKVVKKTDSTFQGHTQELTHSKAQHRGSNLKEAWVRPILLILWSRLERQEDTRTPPEDTDTGSHFRHLVLPWGR